MDGGGFLLQVAYILIIQINIDEGAELSFLRI